MTPIPLPAKAVPGADMMFVTTTKMARRESSTAPKGAPPAIGGWTVGNISFDDDESTQTLSAGEVGHMASLLSRIRIGP
ncbi:hypothetical protein [Embleya sp. NPDC050493]|uniref:hypothetical protein n=1 Tax=Embleya sp. NPDC050493 TaxID=3363989 RepID=UPI0037B42D19